MNNDIFEGKWKQLKGSVQSNWGKLTESDLDRVEGNRERLIGIVQERYGKSKEEAKKEVEDYLDSL
ncbi:CsbD family protein [Pseudohongiella sp.]|uniref:CsbD-like domain-containing protein n=1 Tax=marine sediment metagenome TaxID=412755 RepID=A0A0F9VMR0_9ZZZZ|nr:CsbD family protein [Pseudohongiella sp.]HDZ10489.1 CsbD family protein [Pseudohongiella sp.]HEA63876.1 CsbD family protein [Pseudohongiella sp.]